jgi:peroxiredoxin
MKIKTLITFTLSLFILTSCNQPKTNSKSFILKGKIDGSNTEYVVLSYLDSSNVYVSDTLLVENQSFSKEGYLMNTHLVSLTSNLTGSYMEDPNRLMFFLEPNKIDVTLTEGQFAKAKINGSKTQIENENLDKTTKPFYEKIELIRTKRQKLIDENVVTSNENLETEIENLTTEWQIKLNEIKNVRLQYVINNPQSYLSADVINFYGRKLPIDSLETLYTNLNPILKESSYGLKIQEQIESHVVNSGDVAPSFSLEDIDGNVLSLNQFKGKTVLLDFGAAWCVPCVKNHPEIKRIYDEYHSKGLEIIGISFDKEKSSWKENIKKEKLNWQHIYEGMSNVGEEGSISKSYYVQPIPAYILIDEKGIIIDRYSGADMNNKSLKDLEEKLNTLFSSN